MNDNWLNRWGPVLDRVANFLLGFCVGILLMQLLRAIADGSIRL